MPNIELIVPKMISGTTLPVAATAKFPITQNTTLAIAIRIDVMANFSIFPPSTVLGGISPKFDCDAGIDALGCSFMKSSISLIIPFSLIY